MPRDPDIHDAFDVYTLVLDVFEWWVAAGTLSFPGGAGVVGERRSMPDA